MSETALRRRRIVLRLGAATVFGMLFAFLPLPNFTYGPVAAAERVGLGNVVEADAASIAAQQPAADQPLESDRITGTVSETDPFSMIGVTFAAQPTEPVMVRTKDASGTWGTWSELEFEGSDGPDSSTPEAAAASSRPGVDPYGTAPLFVGRGHGYEVSLGSGDAKSADVVVVRESFQRSVADATPVAGAIPVSPPFQYQTRAAWGARPNLPISYGTSIQLAVVHHSDTSNDYSPGDVPGILRSIQAFHMDGRGWADIAYNFVVDKFGGIWEGRAGGVDQPVIGAHALGFNTNTVGVMVIGDYTQSQPSAGALEAVSQVIGWKFTLHDVNPNSTTIYTSGGSTLFPAGQAVGINRVVGHGDTGSTSCPGSISGYLGSIRIRAQQWTDYLRANAAPYGSFEVALGGDNTIVASGWAIDPLASPTTVRVNNWGRFVDVRTAAGSPPRWRAQINGVPPGLQDVCATILGSATSTVLGCTMVRVRDPQGTSPVGGFIGVTPFSQGIQLIGWAADPETTAPVDVYIYIDNVWRFGVAANAWSPSVPQPWASRGNHAYLARFGSTSPGTHQVCMVAVNKARGFDSKVDCTTVNIPK